MYGYDIHALELTYITFAVVVRKKLLSYCSYPLACLQGGLRNVTMTNALDPEKSCNLFIRLTTRSMK